ncbi:MAG TPA: hypothetical protein VD908_05670 [Cytophagales bacterium]|nr:hypothetical protein [Cytophagales bacterium]
MEILDFQKSDETIKRSPWGFTALICYSINFCIGLSLWAFSDDNRKGWIIIGNYIFFFALIIGVLSSIVGVVVKKYPRKSAFIALLLYAITFLINQIAIIFSL